MTRCGARALFLLVRSFPARRPPQVMDMDPFWRPQTNEEREDEGEEGHLSVTNIARQYLDGIRRRKGLATNDKIVVAAEKQRTLTRNK